MCVRVCACVCVRVCVCVCMCVCMHKDVCACVLIALLMYSTHRDRFCPIVKSNVGAAVQRRDHMPRDQDLRHLRSDVHYACNLWVKQHTHTQTHTQLSLYTVLF